MYIFQSFYQSDNVSNISSYMYIPHAIVFILFIVSYDYQNKWVTRKNIPVDVQNTVSAHALDKYPRSKISALFSCIKTLSYTNTYLYIYIYVHLFQYLLNLYPYLYTYIYSLFLFDLCSLVVKL